MFSARDAARQVFTDYKAALRIARVAIGVVGRLKKTAIIPAASSKRSRRLLGMSEKTRERMARNRAGPSCQRARVLICFTREWPIRHSPKRLSRIS